jgi:hypothetical protein
LLEPPAGIAVRSPAMSGFRSRRHPLSPTASPGSCTNGNLIWPDCGTGPRHHLASFRAVGRKHRNYPFLSKAIRLKCPPVRWLALPARPISSLKSSHREWQAAPRSRKASCKFRINWSGGRRRPCRHDDDRLSPP